MKNILKMSAMLCLMSSGVALAQHSNLDSPHNYKRQNPQARQELHNSKTTIEVPAGVNKNNFTVNSVHNYKRQGVVNVSSESNIVTEHTPQLMSNNAQTSPANYKRNNTSTRVGKHQ